MAEISPRVNDAMVVLKHAATKDRSPVSKISSRRVDPRRIFDFLSLTKDEASGVAARRSAEPVLP